MLEGQKGEQYSENSVDQGVREVANRPRMQAFALIMYVQGFHGKSKAFPNTHKRRPKYMKGISCFYIRKLAIRRIEQYHSFPN